MSHGLAVVNEGVGEDRNVLLSHALVLLNVGRPWEALALLESASLSWGRGARADAGGSRVDYLGAGVARGGLHDEASRWIEQARVVAEQHNLWQIRSRVETVRCEVQARC